MHEYQGEKAFRAAEKLYRKQREKISLTGFDSFDILQLLAGVVSGRPYNGNVVFRISVSFRHKCWYSFLPDEHLDPAVDKSPKRDQEEQSNAG